jgi:hypothetical protein
MAALSTVWATLAFGACGSLDNGTIRIVDAEGGTGGGATGGGTGGAGGKSSGGSIASGGAADAGADSGGQAGAAEGGAVGAGPGAGGAPAGGAVSAGAGGQAGGVGGASGCTLSAECSGTTPICEASECRPCTAAAECASGHPTTAFCRSGGCVGCLVNTDCPAAAPVCGADYSCRTCQEGSECSSLACTSKGSCAAPTQVVYALAQTGVFAADCGTFERPCGSLATAASKLTTARPYLVLVPTQGSFNEGATLPANLNLWVVGNHVKVAPYDGSSAFVVSGGSVSIDDVLVTTTMPGTSTAGTAAISCTGGKLALKRTSVTNLNTYNGSAGLQLTACSADVQQSIFKGNLAGLSSDCPAANCAGAFTQTLTVERTLFDNNRYALAFHGSTFLIRNNLFLRNGNTAYSRVIQLNGASGVFAYNTMVGNENGCSYVGLVVCMAGETACGTLSSNLSWNNFLHPGSSPPSPCPDQVYYSAPPLTNTLAETVWPGTGNVTGDPKFVDPTKDNYTPGPGSPALNKGSTVTAIVPLVDYYGNPRPRGTPDIGAVEAQ